MVEKTRMFKRILDTFHTRNIPHIPERCSILSEYNIQQRIKSNILTQAALLSSTSNHSLSTARTKQGYFGTHFDNLSLFWDQIKQSTHHPSNL